MQRHRQHPGFTIVELLIVVVVIAILAAIAIVSYNGITKQANESSVKSELKTAATQLGITKTETGSYPTTDSGIKKSADIAFVYSATADTFCLQATHPNLAGQTFYINQAGSIQAGECPAVVATMQTFTTSHCAALATFTGANNAAITSLADSRGGTTRTYEVAKLADGKCWMLNNLKLGSTTTTTILTPADSNVVSNFTLPQITTTGALEYDLPRAYGPVPGDTGTGATNYGYLYNWPAATAGATRITNPNDGGSAQYSICPANWRLPSGSSTGDLGMLNAKMNTVTATEPSFDGGDGYYQNWQYTGPFKGGLSGFWSSSFIFQGTGAYMWARSVGDAFNGEADKLSFDTSYVGAGGGHLRYYGFAVRCLLN